MSSSSSNYRKGNKSSEKKNNDKNKKDSKEGQFLLLNKKRMRTVKYAEDKKRKTEGKESLIKFKAKHSKKDPSIEMNSKRNADYDYKKYHNEIEEEKKEESKDNKKKESNQEKKLKIARQKNLSTTKDSSLNSQNINEEGEKEIISKLNIKDLFSDIFTTNRVYIWNINYKIKEDELKNFFNECGKVVNIKIQRSNKSRSKCNGYIDFQNPNEIKNAIKKDGEMLMGRKIRVQRYLDEKIRNKNKLEEKFEELEKFIKQMIISNLNNEKEINELKFKFTDLEANLCQTNKKLALLNEIFNQSESFHHKYIDSLNSKINALINSFKILYIRKICNFILEGLINTYKDSLAKTKKIYGNQKHRFCIIVAKKDIKKISKYQINLIIDFLRFTKQISSKIIHLRDTGLNIQIEIFHELLDEFKGKRERKSKNGKSTINIGDMVSIIFGINNNNDEEEEEEEKTVSNSRIAKTLEKFIELEDEKNEDGKSEKDDEEVINQSELEDEEEINESKEDEEKKKKDKKNKGAMKPIKKEKTDGEKKEFSDYEINFLKRIKNIMSGDERNSHMSIKKLLIILKNKIIKNEAGFNNLQHTELDSNYFYNLWRASFNDLPYKKQDKYKQFIDKEKIVSMRKMGKIVKKLLANVEYNIFERDPDNLEELVVNTIMNY